MTQAKFAFAFLLHD